MLKETPFGTVTHFIKWKVKWGRRSNGDSHPFYLSIHYISLCRAKHFRSPNTSPDNPPPISALPFRPFITQSHLMIFPASMRHCPKVYPPLLAETSPKTNPVRHNSQPTTPGRFIIPSIRPCSIPLTFPLSSR